MGFEPTISAGERLKTYALDRAATGTGVIIIIIIIIIISVIKQRWKRWRGILKNVRDEKYLQYFGLKTFQEDVPL